MNVLQTAFTGMTFAYAAVTLGTTFKTTLAQYERQLKLVGMAISLLVIVVSVCELATPSYLGIYSFKFPFSYDLYCVC